MKANEIRVGDYFLHNGNWSYRDHSAPKIIQWEERDWFAAGESTMNLEDLSGIPLNDDWLNKSSLFRESNVQYFLDKFTLTLFSSGWFVTFEGHIISKRIKYLHQLQNIFYSNTEEELTFKN